MKSSLIPGPIAWALGLRSRDGDRANAIAQIEEGITLVKQAMRDMTAACQAMREELAR